MKKFLLSFVLVFATLFTNVLAGDNPRAVIIFDASGSMWGQINGVTKLEIARDALKNVVREWNPNVELGLTVYGHRRKGDCNDIESVIPVGKIDKNKVIRTVMGIKPKGKTPISRSLRKVADELKYTEEKATIILISDGKETCDPDPCAAAKELEKEGIDFITHVIGFNVDKKTSQQLECIAHATGGEYFPAKNAAGLNKAMKTIAKKVEVVVPPKPVVKKLTHNLEITASETKGGKWVECRISNAVDEKGENANIGTYGTYKNKTNNSLLPVGKYTLTDVTYSGYKIDKVPFEIKAGEVTKLNIVFGLTGQVEITASETKGGKWVEARIGNSINEEGENVSIGTYGTYKKKPTVARLPVGKYTLIDVTYNTFKIKNVPFEIKAGETAHVDVVFGQTGEVYATARETEGGKLINASCRIYNEDKSDWWSLSAYKKNPKKNTRQLPTGKYTVNCSYNEFKKENIPFEIKAGETAHVDVVFGQTGEVYATARETEGGKLINASCRIYNEDKSDWWSLSAYKKNPKKNTRQLPTGKYTVNCSYNEFKKENIPFEIKAGETAHVDVVFGQTGTVYITARETEGGKLIASSCRIYNEDKSDWFGLSAYKKNPKKNTRQLPTGKYTVNCSYNEFKKENIPFEIKAGETSHIDVVFKAFMLGAKCRNANEKVSYEVYASSGELVYDKKTSCSKVLKLILDDGKYSVEAKIASGKGEVAFEVGVGKPKKLILDLTNLNHEEEIKADSEVVVVVPDTSKKVEIKKNQNSKNNQINIGGKKIEIDGISKQDQADLKKAAKMLEMLGGMLGGMQQGSSQKSLKENNKADKEFEDMSNNLDMFTK